MICPWKASCPAIDKSRVAASPKGAQPQSGGGGMASRGKSFDDADLDRLREVSIPDALTRMGLYWKVDPDFLPEKNSNTKRLYVSVESRVVELLVNDMKWYDARAEKGGGGGIDLAMYLLNIDFVHAVKALIKVVSGERRP
jgi:hypothetical protein